METFFGIVIALVLCGAALAVSCAFWNLIGRLTGRHRR
jgi:hypothetical protein